MNTDAMIKNWDGWAAQDPMWAILTDPAKRGRKWDPAEFFQTGEVFVNGQMEWLKQQGVEFPANARALDFGCGLGRLTNALANYFGEVHGVDISSQMVAQARELNRHGSKVSFIHNPNPNLDQLAAGAYDLVFSYIVMQHIPTAIQADYLRGFLRALKPGGVALFQCASCHGLRAWLPNWVVEPWRKLRSGGQPIIPMYGIPRRTIEALCAGHGSRVVRCDSRPFAESARFRSDFYFIRKG